MFECKARVLWLKRSVMSAVADGLLASVLAEIRGVQEGRGRGRGKRTSRCRMGRNGACWDLPVTVNFCSGIPVIFLLNTSGNVNVVNPSAELYGLM